MLLHRHGSAGQRLERPSLDRLRPLDQAGRDDARKLPDVLEQHAIERIVSSLLRRCVESVRPLAEARGLDIELKAELSPEAPAEDTRALLDDLPTTALVCTHREVIQRLFDGNVTCEKGGTWVLERRGSRLLPTQYLPPPTRVGRAQRRAPLAQVDS
jgi:phosphohistidine phosphatase SixA